MRGKVIDIYIPNILKLIGRLIWRQTIDFYYLNYSGEVFSSTGNGHRDEEKTLLLNQIKALEEAKTLSKCPIL